MTAVCTAIMAVLAQLSLPLPTGVPISLQTFAMALCGYLLGWKLGFVSCLLYILLGAVGVPVFTGLRGGLSHLVGVTAGFIWGFLPMVLFCGLGARKGKGIRTSVTAILLGAAGLACCHAIGVVWYMIVSGNRFIPSLLSVSVPFLPKDILSVAGGYMIACGIKRGLKTAGIPIFM